jgi:hypothetical protein
VMDSWTDDMPWLGQYVLDERGDAVRASGLLSWARWMEDHKADCHLGSDQIGNAFVSTIFLGLDMRWMLRQNNQHAPLLWETMVFGGPYDLHQQRYVSRRDALEGHRRIVQMLTS